MEEKRKQRFVKVISVVILSFATFAVALRLLTGRFARGELGIQGGVGTNVFIFGLGLVIFGIVGVAMRTFFGFGWTDSKITAKDALKGEPINIGVKIVMGKSAVIQAIALIVLGIVLMAMEYSDVILFVASLRKGLGL